jgi:hypothetical protein
MSPSRVKEFRAPVPWSGLLSYHVFELRGTTGRSFVGCLTASGGGRTSQENEAMC